MIISIILPNYNEEKTIINVLETISKQSIENIKFEIIVVDDGSVDDSVKLLKGSPGLYTKLICLPKNLGKGGAIKEGLKNATGEYILFQDADLEYDPAYYKDLLYPVKEHNADIVMGSRLLAPPVTRVFYFWHKMGNMAINLLFNVLNNTTFTDIYSCYLLYRRSLLNPDELKTTGWEQQAEILSKIVKKAVSMYEVPISYHGRSYDEGKKIRSYHVIAIFRAIIIGRIFS